MPKDLEIYTINDLSGDSQQKIKLEFILKNKGVLLKYLTKIHIAVLSGGCLSFLFGRLKDIRIPEWECKVTKAAYSRGLRIPRMLDFMGRLLLDGNLKDSEIFRVNSTKKRVEELLGIVKEITQGHLDRKEGLGMIRGNYTMIDIAEAYKVILKSYESAVVPKAMIEMAIRVEEIEDAGEKHLCTKALIFSLPGMNRKILETCVYVSRGVAERLRIIESRKKMNLSGLAIVMMPNLMRPETLGNGNCDFKKLSSFLYYVFENFEELVRI